MKPETNNVDIEENSESKINVVKCECGKEFYRFVWHTENPNCPECNKEVKSKGIPATGGNIF